MQMLDSFCPVFYHANSSIRRDLTCSPYRCLNTEGPNSARYVSQCLSLPGALSSEGGYDSPSCPLGLPWAPPAACEVASTLPPAQGGLAKIGALVSPAWHGWCGLAGAHQKLVGGSSHLKRVCWGQGSSFFQLQQQWSCMSNSTCG